MNKRKYIDGNVVIMNGIFYAADIIAKADESYKVNVDEIIPTDNEVLYIYEDYGSIFDTYIIKGGFTTKTIGSNYVKAINYHTYDEFMHDIDSIIYLFNNSVIPISSEKLFYQQIYISIFGAIENYLYNVFFNHICKDHNIYAKVLCECSDIIEELVRGKKKKMIIKGNDCLDKEKLFINTIKFIVYHNQRRVNRLFYSAFGIDKCISSIEADTEIRNDLVHRMGRNMNGADIIISIEQIFKFIEKVELIAKNISKHS